MKTHLALILIIAALALGACMAGDDDTPSAGSEFAPSTESGPSTGVTLTAPDIEGLGIVNGRVPFPGVVTSGQVTETQFAELARLGYDTLVSLRPADEGDAGWEEAYAEAHALSFQRIPVAGAAGVTRENAERLATVLAGAGDRGVVVYCKSGNRVGALFALNARFLDGKSSAESLQIGKQAGLTRLEPHVRSLLGP